MVLAAVYGYCRPPDTLCYGAATGRQFMSPTHIILRA